MNVTLTSFFWPAGNGVDRNCNVVCPMGKVACQKMHCVYAISKRRLTHLHVVEGVLRVRDLALVGVVHVRIVVLALRGVRD